MSRRRWLVRTPEEHEIVLEHGYLLGGARVAVDGQEVYRRERKISDWGFRHNFELGKHACSVVASSTTLRGLLLLCFSYRLLVDGKRIAPVEAQDEFKPGRWPLLLLLPLTCVLALIVWAAAFWKVPEGSAQDYWELRLDGAPHAFLKADGDWIYYAPQGMHGWHPRKVRVSQVEAARDRAVRNWIDQLVSEKAPTTNVTTLNALTGLKLESIEAWREWRKALGESYRWSAEAEERWTRAVLNGFSSDDNELREYYTAQVSSVWLKAGLEVLLFLGLFYLVGIAMPPIYYSARATMGRKHPFLAGCLLLAFFAAILFVLTDVPREFFGYGTGACTTYDGPGAMSCSGPYPFCLEYKPGNTIIFRQFIELIMDPTIRLVRAGAFSWLPHFFPLEVVALGVNVILSIPLGLLVGWRMRRQNRPAVGQMPEASGVPAMRDPGTARPKDPA